MSNGSLRLLHISDLHISNHVDPEDADAVHSFARLMAIEDLLAENPVDKVLVTGDLTDAGDPNSLILAKAWLLKDIPCGIDRRCGLRRNKDSLSVVPGNHDAFNIGHPANRESIPAWTQRLFQNRQTSLANFNRVFPDHSFVDGHGCRYEFMAFGERLVFFVYLDTCFLGDSLEDPPSRVEQVALGKVFRSQTRQVLDWFSAGVSGRLPRVSGTSDYVSGDEFKSSLKVLVAHHYLFPPKGRRRSAELDIDGVCPGPS